MTKPTKTFDELRDLIVQEVRRHKDCDGFKSISIYPTNAIPGTNWMPGETANYGTAGMGVCDAALGEIIPRLQRQYDLPE
jgi:hypothetical protein